MSRRAPAPTPILLRVAEASDADSIDAFRCSTGRWYEEEVEDYVRSRALSLALDTPTNFRLLLAFEEDRLIGCCAHRLEGLMRGDGHLLLAVRLQLMAIATGDQGRVLDNGERLSDLLMQSILSDALSTQGTGVLTAIVARDNLRSLALCERHGLRSQVEYDHRHVRLTGRFVRK